MKILVTGGTGFIGGHLVRKLAESDHQVTCFVRRTSDIGALASLRVGLAYGDVTDRDSVRAAMPGHEVIINLANIYSFWEPDRSAYARVNIDGTRNVLEAAIEAKAAKVIHVSTCGIFGKPEDVPFTEESEAGPRQFSEYFRTKAEGDKVAWELYRRKRLPLVVVYPAAVLGAGDTKTTGEYLRRILERRMPARVLEDCVFTFVHVRDVVEIIYRAMLKEGNIGETYLAGTFRHTFGELNRMASEISGVALPRMRLPGFAAGLSAWMMTRMADLIKRPPLWGLAEDQIQVMKAGVQAEGSKVERELCIEYTPIRVAIEEAIASIRTRGEDAR